MSLDQWLARWLAAGFGSGWLPHAPGTWGSLAALPVGWLCIEKLGVSGLLLASIFLLLLGCVVCALVLPAPDSAEPGSDDPGWIVIDEWVGQWLALAIIAAFFGLSVLNLVLAFAAFRLFDILKPFPIRQVEHLGPAWWSIMADDLLAGLMGGCLILAGLFAWNSF